MINQLSLRTDACFRKIMLNQDVAGEQDFIEECVKMHVLNMKKSILKIVNDYSH